MFVVLLLFLAFLVFLVFLEFLFFLLFLVILDFEILILGLTLFFVTRVLRLELLNGGFFVFVFDDLFFGNRFCNRCLFLLLDELDARDCR